ncbi:coproporphyrinogen III oxidase [bacterium BMS3Abin08]|nr:coproporphyrinogen III oxidase [bacterium BMS3Abin08]
MSNLRIGFVQATNSMDVHWFKPLAFGYLKSYLVNNINFLVEMDFIKPYAKEIDKYDIIAISSTSQDYGRALEIASRIKGVTPEVIIIIGGHHVTYLPETMSEDFDIGVMGEGEETFLELVKLIKKKKKFLAPDDLKDVEGIVYRDNGEIVVTRRRHLIKPLDRIPHPERFPDGTQYIFTSRGCPYKCAFCSSSAFWDKTRMFSAEYVVDEIEEIVGIFPDINHITVEDDLFVISLSRFKRICELLEQRGLSDKLKFSFSVRANLITDEFCKTIKRLNIQSVCFGAESASDRILGILGKKTTSAQNQKALDLLHKHDIPCVCSFIIGVPTETVEEVKTTYEFVVNNLLDDKLRAGCPVNILMPMPGTKMWDFALKNGHVKLSGFDWNKLSIFASYRHSKIESFKEWAELRKRNNSLYLNEETIPEEALYEIMSDYEEKIKRIEREKLRNEELKNTLQQMEARLKDMLTVTNKFRDILPILEDISKNILREGGSPELLNKTGELCYHLRINERAFQLFRKALNSDSGKDEIWNNLGVIYLEKKDLNRARECFSKSLEINPENNEARHNTLQMLSALYEPVDAERLNKKGGVSL